MVVRNNKFASFFLLLTTLFVLELFLRGAIRFLGVPPLKSADYYWAERLWYGRNPEVAGRPIADFDSELGWRSKRGHPAVSSDSIAVFGDSWTYGLGVDARDAFPAQMNRLIPEREIINFGVPGYGLDQMILFAEQVTSHSRQHNPNQHSPKWIVIAFIADDLHRSCFPFYFGKRKPLWDRLNGEGPVSGHVQAPERLATVHASLLEKIADTGAVWFFRSRIVRLFFEVSTYHSTQRCMAELNAGLMERAIARLGDRVLFVHLAQALPKKFAKEAATRGIAVFSVHEKIEAMIRKGETLDSSQEHPGPRYHAAIAELIAGEIRRRESFDAPHIRVGLRKYR